MIIMAQVEASGRCRSGDERAAIRTIDEQRATLCRADHRAVGLEQVAEDQATLRKDRWVEREQVGGTERVTRATQRVRTGFGQEHVLAVSRWIERVGRAKKRIERVLRDVPALGGV